MNASGKVLLITGPPGVGKTTVMMKVAASLAGFRIAGFYTEEIRVNGARLGFELVTFDGKRRVLAHVDSTSAPRVGKYGVEVGAIGTAVGTILEEKGSADVFLIDEIGRMECLSDLFVAGVTSLLESAKPVVATVALKGGGFIAEVKQRQGVVLWEISKRNRNEMPARVISWLQQRVS
jgi:nucleoside-triphosphatase